ncbi:MAG: T9SS type A sorting domain-containing protein [Flavobacteriales bacterium]
MKNFIPIITLIVLFCCSKSSLAQNKKDTFQDNFENKYGTATIQWKENSNMPHRIICNPIKLANSITNATQLEGLLRSFIQSNYDLFHIDVNQIKVVHIQKGQNIWYANFIQTYKGLEVLDSEIVFRVHKNGNLFVFGFDFYNDIDIAIPQRNSVSEINAILKNIYSKKTSSAINVSSNSEIKILPVVENGKTFFKTVQVVQVINNSEINDFVFVDTNSFNIIETIHKTNNAEVTGNVKGEILPTVATDIPELQNLDNLTVSIDGNQVLTDEFGNFNYTIAGSSANLIAQLKGAYVDVINFNQNDAIISQTVQQNETVNLVWDDTNSTMEERNVFYHINKLHTYNKQVDPNFTTLDYPLQCIVNDTGTNAPCNAFWNGTNLHFGVQATNCAMNSAHGASVIYHEYGHAINDRLYNQAGQPLGMRNPILQEAFADITACLKVDDPRFALGWYGPGTFTRNLNNNNTYPTSIVGQQHTDGLILGGAFWDLRLLTSTETAYHIAHFLKYGTPDDSDVGVAFSEVFLEALIADDDDGNLMNGTPNSDAINNAFCQHGIGSNLFAIQQLNHTPQPNTLDTNNDYPIEISLIESPFISNSFGEIQLVYSTNNFSNTQTINFTQVNATTYEAFIPAQNEGALVKYFFIINSNNCGTQLIHPSRDFVSENYSFYVGAFTPVFEDDFESNQGWQLGDATDNATSGFWNRANPQQTIDNTNFTVQPEDDHSQNGNNCLVTGASQGGVWYANDVDGGKTTVTSPIFSNLNDTSIIEFYKWFVHGAGFTFPAQGQWKMEITNNGTNWLEIENTQYGDHRNWINSKYKISDLITLSNTIQVRFVASDFGAGSIVEALVDDFSIVTLDSSLGIGDDVFIDSSVIVYPNPTSNILFITPKNTVVKSLSVYSISGKRVFYLKKETSFIDVSKLSKGMYLLEVISEKGKSYHKFIKK